MTGPYFSTSSGCRALMELHPDLRHEPFMKPKGESSKIVPNTRRKRFTHYRFTHVCITAIAITLFVWIT